MMSLYLTHKHSGLKSVIKTGIKNLNKNANVWGQ